MKALGILLALSMCFFLAATTIAEEEKKERRIKIVALDSEDPGSGETVVINAEEDLALGETREIVTDDGKTVTIERTFDDEIKVRIDGEDVLGANGATQLVVAETRVDVQDGDESGTHKVVVRHTLDDCENCEDEKHQVRKIVVSGDGDVDFLSLGDGSIDLDSIDWESMDETDLEMKILELLGGSDEVDGKKVVVIKKKIVEEKVDD